ncbi:MAG: hypothetical protein R3C01_07040 [Planctomycetaceae bacterium]
MTTDTPMPPPDDSPLDLSLPGETSSQDETAAGDETLLPVESDGLHSVAQAAIEQSAIELARAFSDAISKDASPVDGTSTNPETDARLYVPESDRWRASIKTNSDREYCFSKKPGEEFFHLLMQGEIHLDNGDEKLCLNCAFLKGVLTTDRLFWQRSSSRGVRLP